MKMRSDGNGEITFSRGLVWVLGLAWVALLPVTGYGVVQLIGSAVMQEQVDQNAEDIEGLELWGPGSGDRYTANDARRDWKGNDLYQRELKDLMVDEFQKLNLRLDRLER